MPLRRRQRQPQAGGPLAAGSPLPGAAPAQAHLVICASCGMVRAQCACHSSAGGVLGEGRVALPGDDCVPKGSDRLPESLDAAPAPRGAAMGPARTAPAPTATAAELQGCENYG